MMMTISPVMERQLAAYNRAHPNHPPVTLWYNPRSVKARWATKFLGVPQKHWRYQGRWEVGVELHGRPRGFHRTTVYLDRGRWFLKLFTWYRDAGGRDGGFLAPDARIFTALRLMDTTKHRHYERVVEAPEEQRKATAAQDGRSLIEDGVNYHKDHDRLAVPVGSTDTTGRRDWRHRTR